MSQKEPPKDLVLQPANLVLYNSDDDNASGGDPSEYQDGLVILHRHRSRHEGRYMRFLDRVLQKKKLINV